MALRNYIFYNFWWKLLSLLLAAMTWLIIQAAFQRDQTLQQTPVVTSSHRFFPTIPIAVMAAPSDTNRYRLETSMAAIEVIGTAEELASLQTADIHAFVDVTGAADLKQFRRPVIVQAKRGSRVELVTPANISVERVATLANPRTNF